MIPVDHAKRPPSVIDGELMFVSPSLIVKFDPNSDGGCYRKGYYRYVLRVPEPQRSSAALGTQIHAEIEQHADPRFANRPTVPLGYWSQPAKRFIPTTVAGVEVGIESAGLRAAGVPVAGFVDMLNTTGTYIDSEGETWDDPAGTIEIIDWKSTSDPKWAKTPQQVGRLVPMVTYARALAAEAPWARLSHIYLRTRGRPEAIKRTTLLPIATIHDRWEQVEGIVRSIKDVVRAASPLEVEANTRACPTFGGCYYRDRCPAYNTGRSLEDLFGAATSASLLGGIEDIMSIKDKIKASAQAEPSMADLLAGLEAEEKAAAAPPPAPAVDPRDAAFAEAWQNVNAAGKGFPALADEAAVFWARMAKQDPPTPGSGFAGGGLLSKLTIREYGKMLELAAQLGKPVSAPAAAPVPVTVEIPVVETVTRTEETPIPVLAPDAPASDPALAAVRPVEAAPQETGEAELERARQQLRDAGGSENDHSDVVAAGLEPVVGTKPKRTRKAAGSPPGVPAVGDTGEPTPIGKGVTLYINAIPEMPYLSLDGYVDGMSEILCRQFGAADLRCAAADGPLGFGKWRGALAALARETPPAPGAYVVFTRGRDLHEVVADALASKASLVVRGV